MELEVSVVGLSNNSRHHVCDSCAYNRGKVVAVLEDISGSPRKVGGFRMRRVSIPSSITRCRYGTEVLDVPYPTSMCIQEVMGTVRRIPIIQIN